MEDEVAVDVGEGAEATEDVAVEPTMLDADTMYRFGDSDPMSGADYHQGYQRNADYTQKTQALAEDRQAWEAKRSHYETELRSYVQQLQQDAASAQQPQQAQVNPAEAIIQRMRDANGGLATADDIQELMAIITQQMQTPHPLVVEAMQDIHGQLGRVQQPLNEMISQGQTQKLDAMVNDFMESRNVPLESQDAARELFLDIYRANEPTQAEAARGQTMENMFSELAGQRLDGILKMASDITKSQANSAQANLGRQGGDASPSNTVKPPMTTEEIMAVVSPKFD